jgi:hypothetical protein
MSSILAVGERIDGHAIPVLNERAVHAGAGILSLLAIVAFMNEWLLGDFQPTRVFVGATASRVGQHETAGAAAGVGGTQAPSSAQASIDPAEAERCKGPDFARAMGHEERWKLHNHCK